MRRPPYAYLAAALVLASCASTPRSAPPATVVVAKVEPPVAPAEPAAPPPHAAQPPSEADVAVPITGLDSDSTWGSRNALVTIVFFGDFQCPFTGRSVATMHELEEKYGPQDLRIVWKNDPLPFHPNARPAAEAAMTVAMLGGSDAFWRFFDTAFKNQAQLAPSAYEAWAQAAGVDVAEFQRRVESHAVAPKVDQDLALAKRLSVNGTPAFYVNGVLVNGAQPTDKFVTVIDAELAKAKERIAAGASLDRIYVAMVTTNYAPRPPSEPATPTKEDTTTVWNVPVGGAPFRGPATAPVTIIEFADFQCPYCKRVEETLAKVRNIYGDRVRIVWRDEPLPFHPRALPAAELAREARAEKGEAGFWTVHDALFASQPRLEEADLEAVARTAGLDLAKVTSAIASDKYKTAIAADVDLGDDLQASGTPHFFINGRRLVGAQPFEKFEAIIDEEVSHAQDVLAKGTPKAQLYATLVKNGRTAPVPETKRVPVSPASPFKGTATAPVVIQEFADFQCPFCKRAEDAVREITRDYGPRVKLVWRDLPLPMHPQAQLAAEAAREAQRQAGNDGFWKMHDKLFAGQASPGLERAALDDYAREIGLDMGAFANALDHHTRQAAVDADHKVATDAGISGTPAFIIGGYLLSGAQPASKFRKLVERVLKDGPAKVAAPAPPVTKK